MEYDNHDEDDLPIVSVSISTIVRPISNRYDQNTNIETNDSTNLLYRKLNK